MVWNKKTLNKLFLLSVILGSFLLGFYFGKIQTFFTPPQIVKNSEIGKPSNVDFSLFWEAWRKLEKRYVDPEKINYTKMLYGAISGMVSSLKDPYTIFLPPEDEKIFKEDIKGEFCGVGIEIGMRNGELTVIAPLKGTPAERAGLKAGDKILKVNGTSTINFTLEDAVKFIRGPEGTPVTLTIFREGWKTPRDFKIIREKIKIPSLKWEIKDGDIAYIQLYHFSEKAGVDFAQTAFEILNSPAKKIILDLRDNPGGYLEVAQEIAGWFLEKGKIVAIEDFGGKYPSKQYKAFGPSKFLSYPTVVLINKGSASAAEILAAALRDQRGIKLIGEHSFGKGSVQQLEKLKEGSLKITVAHWLTPKGNLIEGKGLEPDIKVEITEKDIDENRDPQLEKAIEVLKKIN